MRRFDDTRWIHDSLWPPTIYELAEPIPDRRRVSRLLDAGWDHIDLDLSAQPAGTKVLR